jgi:ankyrin repeat protein
VESIRQQPKRLAELAIKILSWIVKAQRALTVEEIQIAVSINPNLSALDELDVPEKATLLEVCASLVIIDESNFVRLAHLTVQEYLLRSTVLLLEIDYEIALACITYFSFEIFTANSPHSKSTLKRELYAYPFLEYGARHLVYHLKHCNEIQSKDAILEFLKRHKQSAFWFRANLSLMIILNSIYLEEMIFPLPFHIAVYFGNRLAVKHLLDEGFSVLDLDGFERSVVHWAAMSGERAILELLLKYGAEVLNSDAESYTALHYASSSGHVEIAKLLIDRGSNISATTYKEETPLHLAADSGHIKMAELLLDRGARVSATTDDSETPLHLAADSGHVKMAELLLDRGARVSATTYGRETPLHLAVDSGHVKMAELLLDCGADVSATTYVGRETPLHIAADSGHVKMVELLLDRGADISATTSYGKTPLHIAALRRNFTSVRALESRLFSF